MFTTLLKGIPVTGSLPALVLPIFQMTGVVLFAGSINPTSNPVDKLYWQVL
jgi:hypothetical protein